MDLAGNVVIVTGGAGSLDEAKVVPIVEAIGRRSSRRASWAHCGSPSARAPANPVYIPRRTTVPTLPC